MNTKPIYNLQTKEQSGVAIFGDYSNLAVYIMLEALQTEFNGDVEEAFHAIKRMQNENLLPRKGSASRPLTSLDFDLYRKNKELGRRHWQWLSETSHDVRKCTGYDSVWGYGYRIEAGFVIVDKSEAPVFIVTR